MNMYNIKRTFFLVFLFYLLLVNIYGFIIMWADKRKSQHGRWRIPERTFFITGYIGGAAGVYLGMKAFRHKTLHNKFKFGIPALMLLNMVIILYIFLT